MPVVRKKPITWSCRSCNATFTNEDKETLKSVGFQHQVEEHELVEENREFFMMGHFGTYFEIS